MEATQGRDRCQGSPQACPAGAQDSDQATGPLRRRAQTKLGQSVQLGREYGAMPYRTFLPSSVSQHSNRRLQGCAPVTLSSGRAHKQETDEPMEGHQGAPDPMLRWICCSYRLVEAFHNGCAAARDCRRLDHLQLVMAHFHLLISVELGKPGKTHTTGEAPSFPLRFNGESLPVPCAQGSTIQLVICRSDHIAPTPRIQEWRYLMMLQTSVTGPRGVPYRSDELSLWVAVQNRH